MVVILEGHEAEWLEHALRRFSCSPKDFSHAVHGSSLGLKCEFNERAVDEWILHLQQSAGHGNGLQFSFCATAIF